jgi:glycosyltransferase involved in cell wall biosynthesis
MRVGVNTLFFIPGEVGGTETYLLELLRAFRDQPGLNEVVLFTNAENDPVLRAEFGSVPRFRLDPIGVAARNRPARILAEQTRLRGRVRASGADVLWSPGYTPLLFPPVPQVTTLHDVQYRSHPGDLSLSYRLATDFFVRAALRHSRRILTISAFARDEIVRHLGARPEWIAVTPLAAAADFGQPAGASALASARDALGVGNAPYLLCTAFSHPHKNLHTLAAGFALASPHLPHHLVLVGKARRGEPELQRALASLPDAARFHRVERLDRETLIAAMQGADAFVFPSLYEGFGLPVLEAQLAGVPVLTTRCASLPEVAGPHADVFAESDPADLSRVLIALLRRPPEERAQRVTDARKHARGFTWERCAALTLDALRSTISPNSA